jgi:hypothetical protein
MQTKQCIKCNKVKNIDLFRLLPNNKWRGECKQCAAVYKRKENRTPEQVERKNAAGRNENLTLEQIENRNARQRKENKTPEQIEKSNARYRMENLTREQQKSRKETRNKREREKRLKDSSYKLRCSISTNIGGVLKGNGSSKNGESISNFLPFSLDELLIHFEMLFNHKDNLLPNGLSWMTWNNYGKYNRKTWNDNDPSTWTWQLDHIIPHSLFKYTTMDCDEFRECWSLSNLRPYSAKQNILDGSNKIRHKK